MTNYVHLVIELSVEEGLGNMMRPKNDSDPFFYKNGIIYDTSYQEKKSNRKEFQEGFLQRLEEGILQCSGSCLGEGLSLFPIEGY